MKKRVPVPVLPLSELLRIDAGLRDRQLARVIVKDSALLKLLTEESRKPKPLTAAQVAKRVRDRSRGEAYLAKAHALGVYEDRDDDY